MCREGVVCDCWVVTAHVPSSGVRVSISMSTCWYDHDGGGIDATGRDDVGKRYF